jgi:hypothetical protein
MAHRDTAAVKAQLRQQLDSARVELMAHGQLAKEELSPKALVSRSVAEHKTAWIIGAALSGLLLLRVILPPKIRSDNSHRSVKTGLLSGLLNTVVSTLAKRAATQLATRYMQDSAQNYITSFFQRKAPP